ncbi:class I SAM-dependent methyltransferase [Sphingomonas piscis]|uniref:Class I SAM-dependent methyltransferase n=1 Tax=Sphingomonas piscis TaxID=2714943 RepID=A0A6G7YSF1_9SPHN|nr:class I SAM-dependent methyltransferase [Sphingomonas piscis]QIK79659.1 class I SAM-dependent methyltransferase [Sphingomonas piscis]
MSDDYWNTVGPAIPGDVAEQYTSHRLVREVIGSRRALKILDLGAGDGRAVDLFASINQNLTYYGVDIEVSPEVASRSRADVQFETFNGTDLPYDAEFFDIIFSHQVFEHVANPLKLLMDVRRVLKPSGSFVGSVSQLEPYHSFSLWNFTIYGFGKILLSAGLKLEQLRPGIDGPTLIMRSASNRDQRYSKFFGATSPLNQRLIRKGGKAGMSTKQINHRMLQYAGHICFVATPAETNEAVAANVSGPESPV